MKRRLTNLARWLMPSAVQAAVVVALLVTAIAAYNLGAGRAGDGSESPAAAATAPGPDGARVGDPGHPADRDGDGRYYTCSMHPQVRQDEAGDCPICGMELVVKWVGGGAAADHDRAATADTAEPLGYACAMNCVPPLPEAGQCPVCGMEMQPVLEEEKIRGAAVADVDRRLTLSPEAAALTRVRTSRVERRRATRTIRLDGELAVQERRRAHISTEAGGRIDRLHAEFEGDRVEAGQPLVRLYSPELLSVQQEFLQARRAFERLSDSAPRGIRESSAAAVASARERLRLAGLTPEQIDEIAEGGKALERVTLTAPIGGTVSERHHEEGQYVEAGGQILEIVDLGVLWAELEAYERDLPWLREGQSVSFTSDAWPGRLFEGRVSWIDPLLDPAARTTRVRVEVPNADGSLKPGMYVSGRVESVIGDEPRLVIPAGAPLITGKRAVVYVAAPGADPPAYTGREVVLGPRTDAGYIVESGLTEGERVVTHGAFQIDSALQILARRSMMNPEGGAAATAGHAHQHGGGMNAPDGAAGTRAREAEAPSREQFASLLPHYLDIQRTLVAGDATAAGRAWGELVGAMRAASAHGLHEEIAAGRDATDLPDLRAAFWPLSRRMIALARRHGNPMDVPLRVAHCPMALDWQGADWLQTGEELLNPYFGDEMLHCGHFEDEWAAR